MNKHQLGWVPLLFAGSALVGAQTPLDEVHLSADIHTTSPANGGGSLVADDDTASIFTIGTGLADSFAFLGTLDQSDVDAYHAADSCGPALFSVSSTVEIAGTVMRPADVFQDNGIKLLDAAADDAPDGANIDAVSRIPGPCDLVVSFDVTVELNDTVYRPDDLIRFAAGSFSRFREGSGRGNLDALHVLDTGSVLASFAAPVPNLGMAFTDQDVIEQPEAGDDWQLSFQPALIDGSWASADTDALYVIRAPIAGDFRWSTEQIEVLESQGNMSLLIERVGLAEGPVTVNWTTADGTAVAGVDFDGSTGGAAFSDGELMASVLLTLFDNAVVDGDKTFFVDLDSATSGAGLVNPTRVRVLIRDDEDFLFADGFESD